MKKFQTAGYHICDFQAHYKSCLTWSFHLFYCFFLDLTTAPAISANYLPRTHYVVKKSFLTNTLCLNLQAIWAAGIVMGCIVERHFPGRRMLLLTFKSASGYSLTACSFYSSYCPPPDFLSISVTKLSLKLLFKLMKLTFLF